MSFNNKVDYIPNQSFSNATLDSSDTQHKTFQKRKWQVLIGTFLLISIVANAVIWSQEPIYQSQAILHFSYTSHTEADLSDLAHRQITLHQQRLKSNSVLSLVSKELEQSKMLTINHQTLFDALSAEASLTGRIITLRASGTEPQLLKPMLDAWVKVYLTFIASETQENNADELLVTDQRLQLLETKISEQQQRLQLFAQENNITSLERDENRALSQTKNLGANLDQALADEAQSQALLNSLLEATKSGQTIINPADKAKIDATRKNLREISANLSDLSEKYTQAYLERDPAIVAKQKKARQLQTLLEQQIKNSQSEYLLDVERDLNTAKDKVQQMKTQLIEKNQLAQQFNQNLEQYRRIDDELKALQNQAQKLKSQQVVQEVSKPFDAKISLLEEAFYPDYAIGPNYTINSLISLLVAAIAAILALLLFSFIFKQKAPSAANHFMVIPGQSGPTDNANLGYNQPMPIASPDPRLGYEAAKLPPQSQILRLLSKEECQLLFAVANSQGKALVGLILSGVNVDEILELQKSNFTQEFSRLQINNQFARTIELQEGLSQALQVVCNNLTEQQSFWSNINTLEDLTQLLVNIGHDAQVAFPEQLSLNVLRHTYLTYLASLGARLNDIEQIAGYTSPSDLALYRNVNQQGKLFDLDQLQTQYPFVATS
ncbi:hypothetical protein [Paraglaciecola arctica]|uniref:hypothetical protein n=1 Tax=Paraglaciecola arctica TaxID=1128911 RepID=UPI001C07950A|nr:hypothetical protein [Paraglaciecola arctica]MBU3003437.1 hypothetical protein [Paraglaciecola arctica]